MSQYRKLDPVQQFKRSSKITKSKQTKPRLPHAIRKQVFLTDTQTSDYTKSSGEMRIFKIQQLQLNLRDLEIENEQLKQTIITMKTNQYYQLNQQKLKELIRQNQKFKSQNNQLRRQLEQLLIQKDFLNKFNKNLKTQCQNLTKQMLILKSQSFSYTNYMNDGRKLEKTSTNYNSSSQDMQKSFRRSVSTQVILKRRKQSKQSQKQRQRQKQKQRDKDKDKDKVKDIQRRVYKDYTQNNPTSLRNPAKNTQSMVNHQYFHGSSNIVSKTKLYKHKQ